MNLKPIFKILDWAMKIIWLGNIMMKRGKNCLWWRSFQWLERFLKKFDAINSLFSSFAGYENKKYNQAGNIVFRMCLPFMGEPNTRFEKELRELDDALKMFNVLDLQDEKTNDLKSRLRDDDFYQSLTVIATPRWKIK